MFWLPHTHTHTKHTLMAFRNSYHDSSLQFCITLISFLSLSHTLSLCVCLSLSCYYGFQWDSGQTRGGEENLIPAPRCPDMLWVTDLEGRMWWWEEEGWNNKEKKITSLPAHNSYPCRLVISDLVQTQTEMEDDDGNHEDWGIINKYCTLMEIKNQLAHI